VILRSTAHLLVVVMLLASGRLLACGWECPDELAIPAEASCHQESAPDRSGLPTVALAKVGAVAHECLAEVVDPRVTVAKPLVAQTMMAALLVATFVMPDPAITAPGHRFHSHRLRFASPQSAAPTVLRL